MFPNLDKRAKSIQEARQVQSQILLALPASLNHLVDLFKSSRPEMVRHLTELKKAGHVRTEGGEIWYTVKVDTPTED